MKEFGLNDYDAGVLTASQELSEYFERVLDVGAVPKIACNWITGELTRLMNENGGNLSKINMSPENLASLTKLIDQGEISSKIAKTVFSEILDSGESPNKIIEEKGLKKITDENVLSKIVEELIASNPHQVNQYREGKTKVIGFFVGQVMKQTQGKGDPALINNLLKKKLDG